MFELSEIKNRDLQNFLKKYPHFQELSDEEKNEYLAKLVVLPEEEQKNVFEFLKKENEKEKLEMLKKLYEKISTLTLKLKKLKTREDERSSEKDEASKLDELLEKI